MFQPTWLILKNGEKTKKGARLYLYPAGHQLYRCSKRIVAPISEYLTYNEAKKKVSSHKLTYDNTIFIETENGFSNTIHYEYYNSKN